MALSLKTCMNISKLLQKTSVIKASTRTLRTTTTFHPEPVYEQEDKILQKVLEDRGEDEPTVFENPYEKPQRKCTLCTYGIEPNYKNVKLIAQFVSPFTGMIYGRHITGLCKQMQERLEHHHSKAVRFGLMPTYLKEVEFLHDPKLVDPERPLRPHKY